MGSESALKGSLEAKVIQNLRGPCILQSWDTVLVQAYVCVSSNVFAKALCEDDT